MKYKFEFTKTRDNGADCIQLKDMRLHDKFNNILDLTDAIVTCNKTPISGSNQGLLTDEGACYSHYYDTLIVTIECSHTNGVKFSYATMRDEPRRDPISWDIYISVRNDIWCPVGSVTDADIPTERSTQTQIFEIGASPWKQAENDYPYIDTLSAALPLLTPPYPQGLWVSNPNKHDGLPFLNDIPEPLGIGAFYGCTNLKAVTIPPSVKYIGEYAFAGTALKTVKVASDCTYYPTSFPPGCTVGTY